MMKNLLGISTNINNKKRVPYVLLLKFSDQELLLGTRKFDDFVVWKEILKAFIEDFKGRDETKLEDMTPQRKTTAGTVLLSSSPSEREAQRKFSPRKMNENQKVVRCTSLSLFLSQQELDERGLVTKETACKSLKSSPLTSRTNPILSGHHRTKSTGALLQSVDKCGLDFKQSVSIGQLPTCDHSYLPSSSSFKSSLSSYVWESSERGQWTFSSPAPIRQDNNSKYPEERDRSPSSSGQSRDPLSLDEEPEFLLT